MIQPAAAPFVNGRIAADALELMDVTGSGISRRLLENAVGRRHRQDGVDGENDHRRPPLGDIIARAEPSAASDEAYFLAQLRAVVAAVETPLDRLLAKYRGRASGPAQFYAAHLDWDERRRTTAISGPAQSKRPFVDEATGVCGHWTGGEMTKEHDRNGADNIGEAAAAGRNRLLAPARR